ncbi:MAG TPA: YfhO family protein [Micromonosporaceae bacterium]
MSRSGTEELDAAGAEPGGWPSRSWWRRRWAPVRQRADPFTVVALLALAGYAVVGIGSPLLGLTVFAATDLLADSSPYREAGLAGTEVQNTYLNDTIDAYLPNIALFVSALYQGDFAVWNPYIIGGTPLGAAPNLGLLSPIALPYLLLPAWLAPGYVKLLEIGFAAAGTFLFLRRVGLDRPAALLGGLVFASSGFMVAWTNWPHTRVAAFIPVLFWALERLVQRRTPGDAVLVSLVTTVMVLGGFPAVAGYGLLFGAGYLLVRVLAEYRTGWRRILGVALGAAGAVVAGLALTAVQVLPFLSYMSAARVDGRAQTPSDHLLPETLVTAIAPWAMGSTDPDRPPYWYLPVNLVESLVYVGAAAVVLAVAALAMPRAGRALSPKGVWGYLVAATGSLLVVLYIGRLPLALLQQLPVLFSENFVGRARSVLGFLVAALAAVGFQLLLSHRGRFRLHWYAVAVWLAAGTVGVLAWWDARRAAYASGDGDPAGRAAHLDSEMTLALGLLVLAGLLAAALWWAGDRRRDRVRTVAGVLLPILVAGQALTLAVPYWPRVDRDTFYPVTDTHRFLAGHLGHDRFAGSGRGMYVGADSAHRLRALTGHFFLNARFAETVDAIPGRQFGDPPTYLNFPPDAAVITHPALDRLAVRYFVASPAAPVPGQASEAPDDGSTARLAPGEPVTVPLRGPLRAVGLTPAAAFPTDPTTRVELVLEDSTGARVARVDRLLYDLRVGEPFWIPVTAEEVPAGDRLTARLTLRSDQPMEVRATAGTPAAATVAPADDGLRLVYAGSAVVYQRLHALPRIRWAAHSRIEPDATRRVALVGSGDLRRDEVVLDAPSGRSGGASARVGVTRDGTDEIEVSVRARAAGHLVVADALQQDWVATVDGRPVPLIHADHGMVAVPVPAGDHEVRLSYRLPYHNLGGWISGLTAALLLGLLGVGWWRRVGARGGTPGTRSLVRRPAPPDGRFE